MSELNEAIKNLISDQGPDNITAFAKVLKNYIDEGVWVNMPGKNDENGFRLRIFEDRGQKLAAMFSCDSETKSDGEDIVKADINMMLHTIFHDPTVDGIAIDPYSTSMCLVKPFLLKLILHGSYPPPDDRATPPKNWGTGIPEYSQDDLLTEREIQNFAMHTVFDNEPELHQNMRFVSACDIPGVVPSLIFEQNNSYIFIYLKGFTTKEEPELTDEERSTLLSLAEKYGARCYWAPVGFLSSDPERFDACLALKGDGFYCKYEGLKEVEG